MSIISNSKSKRIHRWRSFLLIGFYLSAAMLLASEFLWVTGSWNDSRYENRVAPKGSLGAFTIWNDGNEISTSAMTLEIEAIRSWAGFRVLVLTADRFLCDELQDLVGKTPTVECRVREYSDCLDLKRSRRFPEMNLNHSCAWEIARNHFLNLSEYVAYFEAGISLNGHDVASALAVSRRQSKNHVALLGQTKNPKSKSLDPSWYLSYFVFPVVPLLDKIRRISNVESRFWTHLLISEFILDPFINSVDVSKKIHAIRMDSRVLDYSLADFEKDSGLIESSGRQYLLANSGQANSVLLGNSIDVNKAQDTHIVTLFRKRNSNRDIAVLTVNAGYLSLAKNWVCWARRSGIGNFVLLAEDQTSYREMNALGTDVIVTPNAPLHKAAAEYGSKEFQDTMTYRTTFLLKVLQLGLNFLTADMDAIWFDDPFKHLDPKGADLQGQQHKINEISGGLVYLRSTNAGKTFWKRVIACQDENMKFIQSHPIGSYEPSLYTEQHCLRILSEEMMKAGTLSRYLWKNNKFPDGRSFFEEQLPQRQGIWPVVIHNNWIKGTNNKIARFKQWNLWSLDKNDACILPERFHASKHRANVFDLDIKIKILAFDRPESMQRLLNSLENAYYPANSKLTLIVSIDNYDSKNVDEPTISSREESIRLAKKFHFSHGEYYLELVKSPRGLVGQWTQSWDPKSEGEIMVIFEDDLSVSRHWFIWLQEALKKYYIDSSNFDPRLFGISLQNQHTILGESVFRKYGQETPADLVAGNTSFYRYQLVGTWGTVLFPRHWKEFTTWFADRWSRYLKGEFTPCVPTLMSNGWWKSKPNRVWSQWMIRFAFENGYYMLYTNFDNRMALATNFREAGLNFEKSRGKSNELLSFITSKELSLPQIQDVPLYDFHFNQVHGNPDRLFYRQYLFPDPPIEVDGLNAVLRDSCYMMKDYSPSKEDQMRT